MTDRSDFGVAVTFLDSGDIDGLQDLLKAQPDLASARDDDNSTLLIRLIDWPGHRPRASETARVLLNAGAEIDARRNDENGTPLCGALCTEEADVIRVLLEFDADIHASCGWQSGTVLDLADSMCQNLSRVDEDSIRGIAELFSKAAGSTIPSRTPLGSTIPMVFVADVNKGVRFYTEKIGFRVVFAHESEFDKYVSVVRGGAELHITNCRCEGEVHVGQLYVRISAGPVDPLYEEFRDAGVAIRQEPNDQPWGLREFEIEDLDGNWLVFHGPIPDNSSSS